ncbi:hypothetical protein AB6E04_09280 [Vibrio amylolyticus]|uniref:hypothetical protein n=1 Tax=Vibrio amylolyticus TaxID=2847292 RepID=UPI003552719B
MTTEFKQSSNWFTGHISNLIASHYCRKATCLIIVILVILYFIMMFLYPWFVGDWEHVQKVWARWQPLNAAMVAFAASLIAVAIVRNHEIQNHKRKLRSREAIMPVLLSELGDYNKQLFDFWFELHEKLGNGTDTFNRSAIPERPLNRSIEISNSFIEYLEYAEKLHADKLAQVLIVLQYLTARTESINDTSLGMNVARIKSYSLSQLLELTKMRVEIGHFFEFIRGDVSEINLGPITLRQIESAACQFQKFDSNIELEIKELAKKDYPN